MEGEDEDTGDPRSFTVQPGWKKFIILVAGSFMNFLLGLLIVLIIYSSAAGFYSPVIAGFVDGCPYEGENALQVGDEIYKIDGHRIYFVLQRLHHPLTRRRRRTTSSSSATGRRWSSRTSPSRRGSTRATTAPMYGFSFASGGGDVLEHA